MLARGVGLGDGGKIKRLFKGSWCIAIEIICAGNVGLKSRAREQSSEGGLVSPPEV